MLDDVAGTAMPQGEELLAQNAPAAAPRRASLTHKASLNAGAALLDYSAKIATGLVLMPLLVSHLGPSLFGIWEMLSRLIGYMTATDGRPTQALRLVVASHQDSTDDAAKRGFVGGALVVWMLFLPLVVVAGALIVWLAPTMTKASPALAPTVRLTAALLAGGFLVGGLTALPESVLRGMNLGYRRLGWQAALNVIWGVLAAGAVVLGLGLVGLGLAHLALLAVTGACFWALVRRYVPWFGVAWPTRAGVRSLVGMSGWLALGDVVSKLLLASDVIVLGMMVSPAVVTTYVLTGYAARLTLGLHEMTIGAAMPGLGGVIGQRQFARAAVIRRELMTLAWLFAALAGCTILLWNRSFLALWVGAQHYAGAGVNLLIVITLLQTVLIRTDAYIIDTALRPGARATVGAIAAVITITLSIILARAFGIVGLCGGVLAGRLVQSVAYPILTRSALGGAGGLGWRGLLRPAAAILALFAVSAFGGERLAPSNWLLWGVSVALSVPLVACLAMAAGLTAMERRTVLTRLRTLGVVRIGR